MPTEEWRPVVGYESAYEVSSHGRVRSRARQVVRSDGAIQPRRSAILRPGPSRGYPMVSLHRQGVARSHFVHTLVAEAFHGPRPPGLDVCHVNDVKTDNRPANLRYGTRSQNVSDSVRNGTHPMSSKTHCKHGHEFTPENTRIDDHPERGVSRICRTCTRLRARKTVRANA